MTWFTAPNNQAGAEAAHAELVTFVVMDLPSGVLRLHTRVGTIRWVGEDWLGVGKFGSISPIAEDALLRPSGVTLTLSGVDADLVSAALFETYHGRGVEVYAGFLSTETFVLLAEPEPVFRGTMDQMTVTLGQNTGTISVQCEGELARWQRHSGLVYSHESQTELLASQGYSGDRGFDQIPYIQNRVIDWTQRSNWGYLAQRIARRHT